MLPTNLILYSWLAGFSVFLGGIIAYFFERKMPKGQAKEFFIHSSLALGSGVLLSAVALVLIPRGLEELELLQIVISFLVGIAFFSFLDSYLSKKGGQVSTLLAMLMDFIPEAIALGALFSVEPKVAVLLAFFIALQNIPEAFNSYRDLLKSGLAPALILSIFFLLSFVGVISALVGTLVLSDKPDFTAILMVFSSGGILYLLFNDLIPTIKIYNSNFPAKLASFGFMIGIIGEKLI